MLKKFRLFIIIFILFLIFLPGFAKMQDLRQKLTDIEEKMGDSTIFYDALFKTMQGYLGNRMHVPPAGLTFDIVNQKLLSEDVEAAIITKVRNLFTVCDTVRFAFIKFNDEKMNDDYKELEDIIKYLERRRL